MSLTDTLSRTPLDTMAALRAHRAGDPDSLALERLALPHPRAGEAVVRVRAAAITRDELGWPASRPVTPCHEFCGTVAAVAVDVRGVEVGDAVYALAPFDRDGAAAEFVRVPARLLARKPAGLGDVDSAAIPLAALTAGQALFDHGGLEAGQRVVVHGAAGAVGAFAVQLALAKGAHVIAATSDAGAVAARALGAHEVLVHGDAAFEDAVRDVDLVVDTVGHDMLRRSLPMLRRGGRFVTIAAALPPDAEAAARERGVQALFFIVEPNGAQLQRITDLVEAGDLRPHVDEVFPLSRARAAFARSLDRAHAGKVVLRVAD